MVSAFQSYAEKQFKKHYLGSELRRNIFQNLDEGTRLFNQIYGFTYLDILGDYKMNKLKILFNKRHLLEHNSGIIDKSYILKTGDHSQQIGQRIIIKKSDVQFMIESIILLAEQIKDQCSKSTFKELEDLKRP